MSEISSPTPPKHDVGNYVSEAFALFMKEPVKWVVIGLIGQLALGVGYWGGFQHCAMKQIRGETLEFKDVLMPFEQFGRLFIPSLIASLIIGVGFVLCILPGIVAAILLGTWWFFLWPLMLHHENLTWQQARDISKETVQKDFMGTFIVVIAAGFLGGIGGVVGFTFLTAGLTGIIQVLAFQRTFGGDPSGVATAPHGPPGALPSHGAPQQGWGAPGPAAAPPMASPDQSWGQPAGVAPAPAGAPAQAPAGWGAPAAAPPTDPAWGAPAAAPPADPAWGAPAAAPPASPGPVAEPAASSTGSETGVQSSTSNPDEVFTGGRTMAMSAVDFEKMLKGSGDGPKS
jgi:hypothetical protein